MKSIFIAMYTSIILLPAILWLNQNDTIFINTNTIEEIWYPIAQVTALVGLSALMLQVILASRFSFIERWFGQDVIMRFHRTMGLTGFFLILLHPVALTSSYLLQFPELVKDFLWPVWGWKLLGQISFSLLLLIVVLSVWTVAFKLKYHWWRRIHTLMYLVILGGFIHSLKLGSDLFAGSSLRYYWYGLGTLALLSFLHSRVINPLWPRLHPYTIASVQAPATRVHTIAFEENPKHTVAYAPGQFLFVKFLSNGITGEWHPFTISSSPTEPNLKISAKESGDWTSTLGSLMPGDRALIQAPFGRFSFTHLNNKKDLVFIAGGIGITPFRSMLKYMQDTNMQDRSVQLLYANRTRHDIAFFEELNEIEQATKAISIVHVLSDDPTWQGEHGRINEVCITKYIKDITAKEYFICGPPPMMAAIKNTLRTLGVPRHQIHTEEFSLK